jgi:hypothetical protein
MGIRFTINESLYVATEMTLTASLGKEFSTWKTYQYQTSEPYVITKKDYYEFQFFVRPATGIFFFYRF